MKFNKVALLLAIIGCNAQAMVPRAKQMQEQKKTTRLTPLQRVSLQLKIDKYISLKERVDQAVFQDSIPVDQNYFKNLAECIDFLTSDANNLKDLATAQQYKNELHIRAILTLVSKITSGPQAPTQKTSYFDNRQTLEKYH